MVREIKVEEKAVAASLHGDVLEAILSHVPLIDLVPACHVSTTWKRAVSSSLRHFNKLKPWLIVHTQRTRSPYVTTTHAYDPRSQVWIEVKQSPIKYVSALRSSHSTLLYMLSPSKFSFSFDPLQLTWHHTEAPIVWRTDPIVALVGHRILIAGGTCDFEDDPLAVEMYDMKTSTWDTCESMPAIFKDSAASTSLSIAASSRKMFVTEKSSGITYSFDPSTKNWQGPYDLRPDPCLFFSAVGFSGDRLILVGLIGDAENVKSVKMWEVVSNDDQSLEYCREIGDMPFVLVEKLRSENCNVSSISVSFAGDFVYICNPSEPEEVVLCEFGNGGVCRWRSIRNVAVNDRSRMGRFVFTCSNIGIGDLQRALMSENRKFEVKFRD